MAGGRTGGCACMGYIAGVGGCGFCRGFRCSADRVVRERVCAGDGGAWMKVVGLGNGFVIRCECLASDLCVFLDTSF